MKRVIYIIFYFFIFVPLLHAQIDKLLQIRQKLENKISVGSSPDEVKKILGKPSAVEGGFPKSDEIILTTMPDQVGQLNNSTWFYFLPKRKIIYDTPDDALCYLNGIKVSIELYEEYITRDSIYIRKDEPIPLTTVSGYKLLKDPYLKLVPKNNDNSYMNILKAHKASQFFIPIVCIVFDRGTQVVAITKVFFKIVD